MHLQTITPYIDDVIEINAALGRKIRSRKRCESFLLVVEHPDF